MTKWSRELTAQFVKEYGKYPCLWNKKDSMYRDRVAREDALLKIKQSLNLKDLKLIHLKGKICSLRSTYNMELKKIFRAKKMGKQYKPMLSWFDLMDSFLITGQKKRNSKCLSSVKSKPDSDSEDLYLSSEDESLKKYHITKLKLDESDDNESLNKKGNSDINLNPVEEIITSSSNKSLVKISNNPQSVSKDNESYLNETNQNIQISHVESIGQNSFNKHSNQTPTILKNSLQSNNSDEFEIFGKSVAVQLQQMPLDVALEIQADIQNLLVKRRIALLRAKTISTTTIELDSSNYISFPVE